MIGLACHVISSTILHDVSLSHRFCDGDRSHEPEGLQELQLLHSNSDFYASYELIVSLEL